jgi:hypothetical protein
MAQALPLKMLDRLKLVIYSRSHGHSGVVLVMEPTTVLRVKVGERVGSRLIRAR